jgi:metal-dependent amidase/aminoacylase/carboxypeptidase family protein
MGKWPNGATTSMPTPKPPSRSSARPLWWRKKLQSFGLNVHQGLGNGPGAGGCMLHNPHYDFNDEVLPLGASYLANLVEHILAARA